MPCKFDWLKSIQNGCLFIDMINGNYDVLYNKWRGEYNGKTIFCTNSDNQQEAYQPPPAADIRDEIYRTGKDRLSFHIHLEILNADSTSENIKYAPLLRLKIPD